jgi:hypothetical protein
MTNLSDNVYYPQDNIIMTENIFRYQKKEKKRLCKKNTIVCCSGFCLLVGMNLFSFYIGALLHPDKYILNHDGSC